MCSPNAYNGDQKKYCRSEMRRSTVALQVNSVKVISHEFLNRTEAEVAQSIDEMKGVLTGNDTFWVWIIIKKTYIEIKLEECYCNRVKYGLEKQYLVARNLLDSQFCPPRRLSSISGVFQTQKAPQSKMHYSVFRSSAIVFAKKNEFYPGIFFNVNTNIFLIN